MSDSQGMIIQDLYCDYYESDVTPQELVSSHWQEFHQKVNVHMAEGKIDALQGFGFGDMEYRSLPTRIFSWLTILSYLCHLKNRGEILKMKKVARPIAKKMGFPFSYDCFRQACALSFLSEHFSAQPPKKIINIGDGYGFFSSMLKEIYPEAKIVLVDLGKTLLFQSYYCQKVFPQAKHVLVKAGELVDNQADFIYCPSELLSELDDQKFDFAVNIASMQEMNEETVNQYFQFLRTHLHQENRFYCCNREEKRMAQGEISRFLSYPWQAEDQHFVDGKCPWYKYVLSHHRTEKGPQLGKWRIPLVNYFDGEMFHRFSKLNVMTKK